MVERICITGLDCELYVTSRDESRNKWPADFTWY